MWLNQADRQNTVDLRATPSQLRLPKHNKRPTVFLVHDDPVSRATMAEMLVARFDVRQFETGEQAVGALEETWPDVVLLDMVLPGLDGDLGFEPDILVGDGFALVVLPASAPQTLSQIAFVELQQRRQRAGDLSLVIADEQRIGADGFDQDAGGQEISFAIENVAAARLEDELALGVLLRPGAQFIMPQNLQIDQPVSQPGEGRRQEQRQRDQSAILQSSAHTKHQPPAAIGSSPDGVTGGGNRFHFIRLALSCNLPSARGDRFLIRRRHGRRQRGWRVHGDAAAGACCAYCHGVSGAAGPDGGSLRRHTCEG